MSENLLSETMQKSMHSPEIEVDKRLTQPWGEFLKDYIKVRLDEMQDSHATVYGCDLASEITMPINMDGSYFIWTAKTEEFIKNHWDEAGDFYENYIQEFGQPPANVFTEPDAFHVQMMIAGVEEKSLNPRLFKKTGMRNFRSPKKTLTRLEPNSASSLPSLNHPKV